MELIQNGFFQIKNGATRVSCNCLIGSLSCSRKKSNKDAYSYNCFCPEGSLSALCDARQFGKQICINYMCHVTTLCTALSMARQFDKNIYINYMCYVITFCTALSIARQFDKKMYINYMCYVITFCTSLSIARQFDKKTYIDYIGHVITVCKHWALCLSDVITTTGSQT